MLMIANTVLLGQTNPTAQSIPYTQNFSTFTGSTTTYPDGWRGWDVAGSLSTSYVTSAPSADRSLSASGSNNTTTRGLYDMNGKLGIASTGSALSTAVLSLVTTGKTSIVFSFKVGTQYSVGRINEIAVQYRIGTSGTFTNLAGSAYRNIGTTNTGTGNTPIDVQTVSVNLPTGLENQSVVQFRWMIADVSGSGNRSNFSIDDISVTASAPTSAPVVTSGTGFTGTVNTAISNFQIAASNSPTSYAITAGTLPNGLGLNTTTGIISGTPTVAGTGNVSVTATNGIGTSSPVSVSYNIAKANQTITFAALTARSYGDANFTLSASSTSNLTVAFASSNTAVATVSGNTVTIVGVGTTTITASQAGDAVFNPATDVPRTLIVNPRALTITGLTASSKVYNASNAAVVNGTPVLNNVIAADAADVTLSGTPSYTFANANVGTNKTITTSGFTLTGSKSSNYSLTAPSLSASITAKPLTVTGASAQNKTYDGTTIAVINGATLVGVEPTDTSVTLNPNGVFATSNAGTGIAVTLSLTGNTLGNYSLTQPGLTADILKAAQSIIFDDVPVFVMPAGSIDLNEYAYSTQGLNLTYESSDPSVAYVTGSTLTPVAAGTVTIKASQAGDSNYDPATDVEKIVTVISTPVALAASPITYTSFSANWLAVPGATSYALDVYKKEIGMGDVDDSVYWDFTSASATTIPDGIATSALTQGNNNGTTTLLNDTSASSGYTGASGGNNAGAAARTGALNTSTSAYFQFSVTPTNGNYTLTGISFGARSTGTGPQSYTLRSSLDGYVSDIASGTISGTSWNLKTHSGLSVASTQAITFRIYGYGGSGNAAANTANWRIDDLTLNVTVPTTTTVKNYVLENEDVGNITTYNVAHLDQNTEYFYVVRAVNGTAVTPDSNEIDVTTNTGIVWNGTAWSNGTGPTASEDAEIIGAYNINQSFEVNNLTIVGDGSLAIQNNQDVTVHGDLVTFADNKLVLENDANLVQKKAGADTNPNNFSILAKRFALLPTAGYTFWSSPVSGQNLYSFSDGYDPAGGASGNGTPWNRFYVYNEATDYFVTKITNEIELNSTSTFETGRGYAIKGKNTFGNTIPYPTTTFNFTGKVNNGQLFSQALNNSCTVEAGCEKGYNLVGNPYPSSIDFEALYNANSEKIFATAYFWTNNDITATQQAGTNYTGNNYAIYNLSGGTGAVDPDPNQGNGSEIPNGIIKLGQGFIVKAKVAGKGQSLEFNNSMRLGYNPDAIFYNSKKADKNRFWLTLTSPANVSNTILVAYMPEATNDFEINYDGELFVIGSDSFYSILGSRKLAIQGKADFNVDDKVTLGNVYSKNGEYKISIKDKDGIFKSGQSIYLKDKVLNKIVNLSQGDYTFQGVKGTDATRFEIVYKEDAVLATDSVTKSNFNVYKDGNDYVVISSNKLGRVDVYDTAGRLMRSVNTNETTVRIDASAFSNGVYILKAENSGDMKTKKVIK